MARNRDLRLTGDRADIAAVLAVLATQTDIAYDGRAHVQRGGPGVRLYAQVRAPQLTSPERSNR